MQAKISADAVLHVNDVIAVIEIGEVDVQGRAACLSVRGFQPARLLNFVSAENLGIGYYHQLFRLIDKAAMKNPEIDLELARARFGDWLQAVILLNFSEAPPLTVVIAKDMNRITLPDPPMQLRNKFAALRLGYLRIRNTFSQGAKSIQGIERKLNVRGGGSGGRSNGIRWLAIGFRFIPRKIRFNNGQAPGRCLRLEAVP